MQKPNKRGRKPIEDSAKRTIVIPLRVNEEERELIERYCDGKPVASTCRELVLAGIDWDRL